MQKQHSVEVSSNPSFRKTLTDSILIFHFAIYYILLLQECVRLTRTSNRIRTTLFQIFRQPGLPIYI